MITQLVLNGLVAGSVCSLAAVGFSMVQLSRRFFDFSVAGTTVLVAYISFWLGDATRIGLPAMLCGVVTLSCVVTFLLEFCAYRPLRSAGSGFTGMLAASLGLMIVCVNIVSLGFGDAPFRPWDSGVGRSFEVLAGRITPLQVSVIVVGLICGLCACFGMESTAFGTQLRAVADDAVLARAVGLPLGRIELIGATAGLAFATGGVVLSGMEFGLTPSVGFQLLIPAVTASVIGGVGSVKGAFVAGFFVGLLEQGSAVVLGVAWQEAMLFCIVILIFLVKPNGIWVSSLRNGTHKWIT